MNSDLNELLRAASYAASIAPSLESAARTMSNTAEGGGPTIVERTRTETVLRNGFAPLADTRSQGGGSDLSGLTAEVSRLTEATRAAISTNALAPKNTTTSAAPASENSFASTALRTAAMMTGVGPLVTGLMKLFGSSEPEALPPLEKFVAPASMSVEAALTPSRDFGALRYAQGGIPDTVPGGASQAAAPTIQVNIQALDSQSFLDRQDDIARAVREAMLHSNSLNDVVMEL